MINQAPKQTCFQKGGPEKLCPCLNGKTYEYSVAPVNVILSKHYFITNRLLESKEFCRTLYWRSGDLMTSRMPWMHPDAPFISLPLSYMFVKYLHKNKAGMMRKILSSHDEQHSTLSLSEKILNQNHCMYSAQSIQHSCTILNWVSQFIYHLCSYLQRDRTIHKKKFCR